MGDKSKSKRIIEIKKLDDTKIISTVKNFAKNYYIVDFDINALAKKYYKFAELICACCDDDIIGYVSYYANDNITKTAYISMVVVKKQYRGKGIAKSMIQKVIDDCKNRNFKSIRLEVHKTNYAAIQLYTKLGFRIEQYADGNSLYFNLIF